ncbi:MAG TPA: ATP-binding protein [Micromonosporaceae bacterium]
MTLRRRPRRRFIAVATEKFDSYEDLPVAEEVAVLRDWLCDPELGEDLTFEEPAPYLAESPSQDDIRRVLQTPPRGEKFGPDDVVVVYMTGHGVTGHDKHWLVLRDTDPDRLTSTAIETHSVIAWLHEAEVEHLFVVVDLCYAGKAAIDVLSRDRTLPRTATVLFTAAPQRPAPARLLTDSLRAFLEDAKKGVYGEQPYLKPTELRNHLEVTMSGQAFLAHPVCVDPSPCLPNPGHRREDNPPVPTRPGVQDLALRQQDLETHWGPKARGVANADETGWLFTGRREAMRRLTSFVQGPPGTLLVTGVAGCGKSAILSRLVTLADARFRERYAAELAAEIDRVPDAIPPVGSIDVAVHATGKTAAEVVDQIRVALNTGGPPSWVRPDSRPGGVTGPPPADPYEARLAEVNAAIARRRDGVTIVVDALDESQDPLTLLRSLLSRLTGDFRLVVGVRSPGIGAEQVLDSRHTLADTATAALRAEALACDAEPYWSERDLGDYIAALLRADASRSSPYRRKKGLADRVGAAVATAVAPSYLAARIVARSLATRHAVPDFSDPAWRAGAAADVAGLLREEMLNGITDPGSRQRALHLLRAVAYAKGRGIPWQGVWPTVAVAVAGDGTSYSHDDIAWLLAQPLAGYLTRDVEDDVTVYRLFHDALTQALRGDPAKFLAPGP